MTPESTEYPTPVDDDHLTRSSAERYNVVWHFPGPDSAASMPLGNGDLAINLWVEPDGDLLFYVSKTDAWSDEARLLKLGRVRVSITPNPFVRGNTFRQELRLERGEIQIDAGAGDQAVVLRVWVDAHHPVVRVQVQATQPVSLRASTEIWRTEQRTITQTQELGGAYVYGQGRAITVYPDTLLPGCDGRVVWYHRNERSIWRDSLEYQGLSTWADQAQDPLLKRTFGCVMQGDGMVNDGDAAVRSTAPAREHTLNIVALTQQSSTAQKWSHAAISMADRIAALDVQSCRAAHHQWWHEFWDRSFIHPTGSPEAELVGRGYALQRFIIACAARGAFPIKFNGSLFTVDAKEVEWSGPMNGQPPQPSDSCPDPRTPGTMLDADYRRWGGPYWHQNTRLPYWAMLASGDADFMGPFFRLYLDNLPLARFRCQKYFGHGGAFFPETMHFWGTYADSDYDYGSARDPSMPVGVCANPYIRYHYQGAIEVVAAMLSAYAQTLDERIVREAVVPLAEAVLEFYQLHYQHHVDGRWRIEPAQALETVLDVVNPLPEIAGLHRVIAELSSLPPSLLPASLSTRCAVLASVLPPIPTQGEGDLRVMVGAETLSEKRINVENPELYSIFPYRLHGVGKPDLEMARRTFGRRNNKGIGGWSQDGIQAAMLGLIDLSRTYIVQSFGDKSASSRFPGFWAAHYDWVPDQDHGSTAMIALQSMLMQADGDRIMLLPAWPRDWDVSFRLHAPRRTVVECEVTAGRVIRLNVTPTSRRVDVVFAGDFREVETTS
jgi:alpha-L-fucosidase 2